MEVYINKYCDKNVKIECILCDSGRGLCRQADGPFPTTRKTLYSGGNLTVFNLGKEDHGVYECVAASVVSSVITSTLLIIERTLRYVMSRDTTEQMR